MSEHEHEHEQEHLHDTISEAVRWVDEHADEPDRGIVSAYVLVVERRDADGLAHVGYYRGPDAAGPWLHRGLLHEALSMLDAGARDADG
jgi:hypothetical protein